MKRDFILAEAAHLYLMGWMTHEIAKELGVSAAMICECLATAREEWRKRASEDAFSARLVELARIDALQAEYAKAWENSKKKRTSKSTKFEVVEVDGEMAESPEAENPAADENPEAEQPEEEQTPESVLEAARAAGVDPGVKCRDKGATKDAIAEAAQWQRLKNLVATEITTRTDSRRDGNPAFLAGIQWCIDMRVKIGGLAAAQEIKLGGELRVAGTTPEKVDREMLGILAERMRLMQAPQRN